MATILAISPHLDDAVLSYGGQLASLAGAGHQVVVFTVFAGSPAPPYSPAAIAFHEKWELSGDPVAHRREEDHRALSVLGVTPVHGGYLDAIYRRSEHGTWLIEKNEHAEHRVEEPGLVTDIASTVEDVIREHSPDRIVTCAAIGEHADHRRARDATVLAASRTGVPLALWEDFPYVTWTVTIPALPAAVQLSAPVAEPLTQSAWETKNRALQYYESQLAMLEAQGPPLGAWLAEHCAAQASRYGVAGVYEVVRQVTGSAADRSGGRGAPASAGISPGL